jgi:hypothetical protein
MAAFSNNRRPRSSSARQQGPAKIQQLWSSFRGDRSKRNHSKGAPVGTQAKAIDNIQHNQRHFAYPKQGFVEPIEHSLLYNMISEPSVYPEDVVLSHIAQEDFTSYLLVAEGTATTSTSTTQQQPEQISYAQLSALLALSAEKFPPAKDSDDLEQQPSIPRKLCKTVLRCVVRYAEEHTLDRKAEVQELLEPVQDYATNKTSNTLLPMYVAYMAGILIPGGLGIGLTVMSLSAIIASSDQVDKEAQNVHSMRSESHRSADVEKTGLLDEVEEF